MSKVLWEFTDEHRKQVPAHNQKWIDRIMSTEPMTAEDRAITDQAIRGLYKSAGLESEELRIVFVSSPVQAAIVAAAAAKYWRDHGAANNVVVAATNAATFDATNAATFDAALDAIDAATDAATLVATDAATRAATSAATDDATDDATRAATSAATDDATDDATRAATLVATDAVTWAATRAATYEATSDVTWAATRNATDAATSAATRAATSAATRAATRNATDAATLVATYDATLAVADAATRAATDAATRAATRVATNDTTFDATTRATIIATRVATNDTTTRATIIATDDATTRATDDATRDATTRATDDATRDATTRATDDATTRATTRATFDATSDATTRAMEPIHRVHRLAASEVVGPFHAAGVMNCANGGNHWGQWLCYLTFVRDVIGFSCKEHKRLVDYEQAAIHSSWRFMMPEFCIVSDRPRVIRVNDDNEPHCDDGPSHTWADGWCLWHIDGVPVDEQVVMQPETQTIEQIHAETNEEARRVRVERFGVMRYIKESGAELLDERFNAAENTYEVLVETVHGQRLITHCPSTGRRCFLSFPDRVSSCAEAQRSIWGVDANIIGRT